MTQDFYSKARALHEEFQKRELHYLNKERKLHSDIMWKKELNLSFQEYLQRISQREKKNEETYKNIMKQIEELDRHTDAMSLKLEKLGIFRNSLTSLQFPSCLSNVGSNPEIYGVMQSFNSKTSIPILESIEASVKSQFETNSKYVSTQTENIYCEKCGSLVNNQFNLFMKNIPQSSTSILSSINDESQITHSTKSPNECCTPGGNLSNSQFIASSVNNEFFMVSASAEHDIVGGEISKTGYQANEKTLLENLPLNSATSDEKCNSFENKLKPNSHLIEVKTQNVERESKGKLTELQLSEKENYESKSPDAANIETFTSKSDAESMNHEFDFLESETTNVSFKNKDPSNYKNYESNDTHASLDKAVDLVKEHPSELVLKGKKERRAFHSNSNLDSGSDKSETSGSISGLHSPNVSIASDSDTIYGKGSCLTASAAYQALLGNTIIPEKMKRSNSNSESEDEVENALAHVVQKSHVKSKSSVQPKNDKSASEVVDSKPVLKGFKPSSMNKPQSKLSKNTRKVLGLDTSSGSEVELAIKSPEKKVDEDSDEFSFYD